MIPWLQTNWLSLVALCASGASAFYAWRISRTSRDSLHLSALLALTQEARSNEFINMMQDVVQIQAKDISEYYLYLNLLDPRRRDDTERAVRRISYFLDNVGLYVRRGIIDKDLALATFGVHAANAWLHLAWRYSGSNNPMNSYPHNFRWLAKIAESDGYKGFEALLDWRQV